MANHGNEHEHESEPVSFRDNRKIDPETGKVRGQEAPADAEAAEEAAAAEAPVPEGVEGDALSQAEAILNSTDVPAGESVAQGVDSEQAVELRNDLLRLQAEYVNYRKRVERDRAVAGQMAIIGVLNSLLPVLDDIDAARQHGDLEDGPFAAIAAKLENALKVYGLERISETDVEFDPNIHEALMQQQSADVQVDSVSQILRTGYKSGDRVLRAAQVVVAVPAE
jgi:molecular chaperone GrpE